MINICSKCHVYEAEPGKTLVSNVSIHMIFIKVHFSTLYVIIHFSTLYVIIFHEVVCILRSIHLFQYTHSLHMYASFFLYLHYVKIIII